MKTPYDWLTVALFVGIAWLFLRRAMGHEPFDALLLRFFPPAAGCALANHLGNGGHHVAAIALLAAVAGYVWIVSRPIGE